MRVFVDFQQIQNKRFWKSLEKCTLTCKDGIQLEVFTKHSIRRTKHRGLIESMITLEVEVARKCEDFFFGVQYLIFQF
jgi:hypothetical protein